MPRPPASYIQETAEVDARLQDELANGNSSVVSTHANGDAHAAVTRAATVGARLSTSHATGPALLARRSTGSGAIGLGHDSVGLLHTTGWDSITARAGSGANGYASLASSPPPLPPKVPLEH
jgi:hypothetical protein